MARTLPKINIKEQIKMTYFEKFQRERRLVAEAEKYLSENKMDKFHETVQKIKEVENEYINCNNKKEGKKCQY